MLLSDLKCVSNNIDLDEYILFTKKVKENMKNPKWLGEFSKEGLLYLLNNGSKIWIYYDKNTPVCSMMYIPADKESINELGLLNYDYKKIVDYGPMLVNPNYLGKGLQYQMLLEIDKYSSSAKMKYAVVTSHPENIYSINNLLKDEFILIDQKEFKRGIRNIYLKNL